MHTSISHPMEQTTQQPLRDSDLLELAGLLVHLRDTKDTDSPRQLRRERTKSDEEEEAPGHPIRKSSISFLLNSNNSISPVTQRKRRLSSSSIERVDEIRKKSRTTPVNIHDNQKPPLAKITPTSDESVIPAHILANMAGNESKLPPAAQLLQWGWPANKVPIPRNASTPVTKTMPIATKLVTNEEAVNHGINAIAQVGRCIPISSKQPWLTMDAKAMTMPVQVLQPVSLPPQKKKRCRATRAQVEKLESMFAKNPLPTTEMKNLLSQEIGMSFRAITIWFQNKRARVKRELRKSNQLKEEANIAHEGGHAPLQR